MTQEAKDKAVESFKTWSWYGMGLVIIFFLIAFYNKVDGIGKDVTDMKVHIASHDQELKDLKSDLHDVKELSTQTLFNQQKEK